MSKRALAWFYLMGLMGGTGWVGCGGGEATAVDAPSESERPAGHARMVELLQQVHAEAQRDNPYLGRAEVVELRNRLAQIPPGQPDLHAWQINFALGHAELRLGNEEQAIRHFMEAIGHMNALADEIPVEEALRTMFDTGVAFMRFAETRNCVAHHTTESCIFPIQGGGVHVEQEGSRQAIQAFTEVLKTAEPGSYFHIKARWLLNIAYMTLGEYPDGVPAPYLIPPEAFASDEPFRRFTDVAPALGVNSFDLSGGAAVEDFTGDGWLDILVSANSTSQPMHFYVNDGRGGFEDRSEEAGLEGLTGGLNLVHADYDNDGDADVLVLRGAWFRGLGRHPNSLLRNNGDGTFTDVTFETGLGDVHYPTQTAGWADYDNDGDLDLYIGNETDSTIQAPCQLFRNDGAGAFTDVAADAGVENLAYTKGVTWGDFDRDGLADLFVSNMGSDNRLYRNNGDGTFTDVAAEMGVTKPTVSFPTWFWDYDNDGVLDLYVAAYGNLNRPDLVDVAASQLGQEHTAERASLYRGRAEGGFDDVAVEARVDRITLPMGSNFGDLDNDGFLDFYLGTGYPYYEGLMPNVMYRNHGGQRFADVTTAGGFGHLQKGHGVVFADIDQDGDQDVFEQMGGAYPGDAFGNTLYENPGFDRHWIKLQLVGTRSNRSAIGATLRVDIVDAGQSRSIYREVNTGGSFGSGPLRREIGLGDAERIERLEVHWPTSGTTQVFEGVEVDRLLEIVEGEDAVRELPLPRVSWGS